MVIPISRIRQIGCMVLVFLTILYSYPAQADANDGKFTVSVKLMDYKNNPIPDITLKAWLPENEICKGVATTKKDGTAVFSLATPGRYYFTGNLTKLKKRNEFAERLTGWENYTLHYISAPLGINEETGNVPLVIARDSYVDLIDIADDGPLNLHIIQLELGIRHEVTTSHQLVRVYAPARYRYSVKNSNDTLGMLWVYYAAPRTRFVISIL